MQDLAEGASPAPHHAITCPQNELAKRGDTANGLGLWGDHRCTCGVAPPAPHRHAFFSVTGADRCGFALDDHYDHPILCGKSRAEHVVVAPPAETLRQALRKIMDGDEHCGCDHDTEDCCERVGVWCPRCIAAVALNQIAEAASPVPPWQPIATAPKGSGEKGPQDTRHPDYVKPPLVWLLLDDDEPCVGYWDWYYAECGRGYDSGSAWVEKFSGERVRPTHWMPLPAPPMKPDRTPAR